MAPAQVVETSIGSLSNYDGDVNESGKKPVGLDSWQNNNSARASRFFCTFLCRRCTTTTWKCLISRFVENVTTRQQLYFYFPELRYSLLKFNSRKNCQHLTNWTKWNKRDKVWSSANSLLSDVFVAVAVVVVACEQQAHFRSSLEEKRRPEMRLLFVGYRCCFRLTIKPLTKVLLRTTPTRTIMLHLLLKNFCIFASFPSISPASRLPYHSGPLFSRAAVPICPTPQARFLFSFYRLFFLSTVSLLVECLSTSSCREEGLAQRTESRV